jgi:hypothetical protein
LRRPRLLELESELQLVPAPWTSHTLL